MSWLVRVIRVPDVLAKPFQNDLLTLQVDGTKGSAVAGLRRCLFFSPMTKPQTGVEPDIPQPIDFFEGWEEVPDESADNAFKVQWELFLKARRRRGQVPLGIAPRVRRACSSPSSG